LIKNFFIDSVIIFSYRNWQANGKMWSGCADVHMCKMQMLTQRLKTLVLTVP